MPHDGEHGQDGGWGIYGYVPPDPNGARTQTSYDALGRVYNVVNPDGTVVKTRYNGWQVAVIDENGHMVIRESDALGRLIRVKEYTGTFSEPNWGAGAYATTNYTYDVKDQLRVVQDAAGNQTEVFYDKLGRKVQMVDPDMGTWYYAYDPLGNMTRQTDARGQRICFYYDNMNRVVGKIYWTSDTCPAPGPGAPLSVTYQYDNALGDADATNSWGRLRRAYVGSSYTTNGHEYRYDDRGRTVEEKVWVDGTSYTTSSTYDSMDRVKTMAYPDGEVVTYSYLPNGAVNSAVGNEVYVGSTTYTAWGAVDLMKLGASGNPPSPILQVDYSYYDWTGGNGEGRGRLQRIAAGALQDLYYFYDLVGNVEQIQDYKAGSPQTQSFAYDELNRLLSAGASGGSYGNYSETYAYNAIGNLTSKGGVTYGYNDGAHKHAVTHLNGAQKYWYDANGNQVTRVVGSNTYSLSYDAENRLVGVTKNGTSIATFVYGPGGERVKGTVNGVTTVYVGNHYEVQGTTVRKYYDAGAQRVAMRENGVLYWLLVDHLGSTAIVANASGAKVGEVRYKAWGEERPACANPPCGTIPTTYRYTGQRWESGIGLYFYNARWYDPALGRFVQPDTVVPSPSDPQSLNRFAYVQNNPLRFCDPSGHCTGDPNDPNNPDAGCWEKWKIIENKYTGIYVLGEWLAEWTESELSLVLEALDMILYAFGNDLGRLKQAVAPNGPLTILKAWEPLVGGRGRYAELGHRVLFSWRTFAPSRVGDEAALWSIIHEIGHAVDYAGGRDAPAFAAAVGAWYGVCLTGDCSVRGVWDPGSLLVWLGIIPYQPGGQTVGAYASTSLDEDFAQTFAFVVYAENGRWVNSILPQKIPEEFHEPSIGRQAFMINLLRNP